MKLKEDGEPDSHEVESSSKIEELKDESWKKDSNIESSVYQSAIEPQSDKRKKSSEAVSSKSQQPEKNEEAYYQKKYEKLINEYKNMEKEYNEFKQKLEELKEGKKMEQKVNENEKPNSETGIKLKHLLIVAIVSMLLGILFTKIN